jgi:hypothetical protein
LLEEAEFGCDTICAFGTRQHSPASQDPQPLIQQAPEEASRTPYSATPEMEFDLAARGLDDLVLLDEINEDKVHGALKQRFVSDGQMYTFSGPGACALSRWLALAGALALPDIGASLPLGLVGHRATPLQCWWP